MLEAKDLQFLEFLNLPPGTVIKVGEIVWTKDDNPKWPWRDAFTGERVGSQILWEKIRRAKIP